MIVPLAAFAFDNAASGTCDLYISYLDPKNHP